MSHRLQTAAFPMRDRTLKGCRSIFVAFGPLIVLAIVGRLAFAAPHNPHSHTSRSQSSSGHSNGPSHDDNPHGAGQWKLADTDCSLQAVEHRVHPPRHQRSDPDARDGVSSVDGGRPHERIKLKAGMGSYVHFKAPIEPAVVIPELHLEVPVRSDRAGLQVLARVVLPRTLDEVTRRPVTVLVGGAVYRRAGEWEPLAVDDLPRGLDRQVRVLRARLGSRVTAEGAFVDVVVVNIYGGSGETNVQLGSPRVTGSVVARRVTHELPLDAPILAGPAREPDTRFPVRMVGDVLLVQDRPFLVQAIEHRGESLAFLRRLGFNVVQLSRPPTVEQSVEATRCGLWLVSPPPTDPAEIASEPSRYRRVLVWSLGRSLTNSTMDEVADRAQRLRREVPPSLRRPLICQADSNLHEYGRIADVVVHDRAVIGTSCDLSHYQRWLAERRHLTSPETPHWNAVQTQLPPTVTEQAEILTGRPADRDDIEALQLKRLVLRGVASGMRGFLFQSHSRLDGSSSAAKWRSESLSAMNGLLRILQPWAAAGQAVGGAQCRDPQVMTAVLRTERAHLLLALHEHPTDQYLAAVTKRRPIQLTTSGASASGQAYLIGNTAVSSLVRQRVAGGSQVQLPEFANEAIVVVSDDRLVARRIYQQVAAGETTLVAWRRQVAHRMVAEAAHVASQSPPIMGSLRPSDLLSDARRLLTEADQYLKRNQRATADRLIDASLETTSDLRLALWHRAVDNFPAPTATPLCASLGSLPMHWQVSRRLSQATLGENILPGGDFERLDRLSSTGWQPLEFSPKDVKTQLVLTASEPHRGQMSLRLSAEAVAMPVQRSVLAVPPVWVQTPPLPLDAGQVVRIHGWVRLRQPVTGSQDGVMLFDSLGGPALAYRLYATDDWQEFTMYRAAEVDSQLVLTMALTGLGEVQADDVTVHRLLNVTRADQTPTTASMPPSAR